MTIDPNSFDEPVRDYIFDQTESVNDLIEAMAKAGDLRLQSLLELRIC